MGKHKQRRNEKDRREERREAQKTGMEGESEGEKDKNKPKAEKPPLFLSEGNKWRGIRRNEGDRRRKKKRKMGRRKRKRQGYEVGRRREEGVTGEELYSEEAKERRCEEERIGEEGKKDGTNRQRS